MTPFEVIHDTRRESLALRVLCAAWGLFCLVAAWFASSATVIGAIMGLIIGLAFLRVWFLRSEILFDRQREELIWKSSRFGSCRTSLRESVGISFQVSGVLTKGGVLYLHFSDGSRKMIAHVDPSAAAKVAKAISVAASIPFIES